MNLRRFLYNLTANRPCKLISRDGQPYLERYFLFQCLGLTFYLHRFVGGDGDKELHDHPFDALSLILAGSYLEELPVRISLSQGIIKRRRRVRWLNWIRAGRMHRIVSIRPETWTLFIHNRRRGRTWGFYTEAEPTPGQNWKILYHQPYALTHDSDRWWQDVPNGAKAGRQNITIDIETRTWGGEGKCTCRSCTMKRQGLPGYQPCARTGRNFRKPPKGE